MDYQDDGNRKRNVFGHRGRHQNDTMNFSQHQTKAVRSTLLLVFLFILAILFMTAAVDVVVVLVMMFFKQDLMTAIVYGSSFALFIIGSTTLLRMTTLRSGSAVASQLGGKKVPEDTNDFALRRYRNVVEEIAIATGAPIPEMYVLEGEPAINAFAAGSTPAKAAIGVTQGALNRLNRDELQAVIAHEFSHILNGDMRLNTRLISALFGIMAVGIIGRKMLRGGTGGGWYLYILKIAAAAVLCLIGYIGVLSGRIIKAAISRQREYLADASAVKFTRQSQGLTGALVKIAGIPEGSMLTGVRSEEFSHMMFGWGTSSLLATHPPILKRIQRLNPKFDKKRLKALQKQWAKNRPNGYREDIALGFATENPYLTNDEIRNIQRASGNLEESDDVFDLVDVLDILDFDEDFALGSRTFKYQSPQDSAVESWVCGVVGVIAGAVLLWLIVHFNINMAISMMLIFLTFNLGITAYVEGKKAMDEGVKMGIAGSILGIIAIVIYVIGLINVVAPQLLRTVWDYIQASGMIPF